jgi:hypothetical protein
VIPLNWQKSTYSEEASSCVYVASAPTGTILLRESDDPAKTILTTGSHQLGALISAFRPEPDTTTAILRRDTPR